MSDANQIIAEKVLAAVGGKDNVTSASHCMTRLRLNLKDTSIPKKDEVTSIPGVIAVVESGGQYQIVIGQNVAKVYPEFARLAGVATEKAIDENLDGPQKMSPFNPLSLKSWGDWGNAVLNGIVGCLTPILPVLVAAGLIKMLASIISPAMLNIVSTDNHVYRFLSILGDAGFYYFPIFIGWSGAKKFGATPILGMVIGALLVHPHLVDIVSSGEPFTVFGIPMQPVNYSSTVLPMILITWIMGYIEKFLKKYSPDILSTMLVPTLTILITAPLALCVLGPLGSILGVGLSNGLEALYNISGPLSVAIIGSTFLYIVATGMHLTLLSVALTTMATTGHDKFILVAGAAGTYAMIALGVAVTIKAKNKQTKQKAFSGAIYQALGGVGEPLMYGTLFRFKKLCLYYSIVTFVGGLYLGFTETYVYFFGSNNLLAVTMYGPQIVNGLIAGAMEFIAAFALVMVFGFGEESV